MGNLIVLCFVQFWGGGVGGLRILIATTAAPTVIKTSAGRSLIKKRRWMHEHDQLKRRQIQIFFSNNDLKRSPVRKKKTADCRIPDCCALHLKGSQKLHLKKIPNKYEHKFKNKRRNTF